MRAALLWLLVTACCLFQRPWRPTAKQLAPIAPIETHVRTTIGPLSLDPRPPENHYPHPQAALHLLADRYLDHDRIVEERAVFAAFVDLFARDKPAQVTQRFSPISIAQIASMLDVHRAPAGTCIQLTGIAKPCDGLRSPSTERTPVFQIGLGAPRVGILTVRDLSNAEDPAWREFPAAARSLATLPGLVIDLRGAGGSDPRALLPWLAELTGRPELRPLRAIERPSGVDPYVQAYAARYTDRGRDPEVWRALLGPGGSATGAPTPQKLAVVVGRHCDSACELVTRVLEAYAGATVIGKVLSSGRLARDEPAMFTLPHSHSSVYFHATRYLLAADIEAATGPTEGWVGQVRDDVWDRKPRFAGDPVAGYVSWAVRDVAQRVAEPAGWPRCDALPTTAPPDKLFGAKLLRQPEYCTATILIKSDSPASAMERFLATCSPPLSIFTSFSGHYYVVGATERMLAQVANSALVQAVHVDCSSQLFPE